MINTESLLINESLIPLSNDITCYSQVVKQLTAVMCITIYKIKHRQNEKIFTLILNNSYHYKLIFP